MRKRKSRKPSPPKKDRRCWCGAEFTVTNKDALNLIEEFDLFCSDKCVIDYINQTIPIPPTISKNPAHISYDYAEYDEVTNQFYRSKYEVWFARCLKFHEIEFKYEPHSFFLNGHYYTPDFYIPEKELYVECKGLWQKLAKMKVLKLKEVANIILLPSYFQNKLKHYKKWGDVIK